MTETKNRTWHGALQDIRGRKFGNLTVIDRAYKKHGTWLWTCQCDCGRQTNVQGKHLKEGRTRSCGCLHHSVNRLSTTRAYRIWNGMKDRCYDPKSTAFGYYGGRGIYICNRWRNSVVDFIYDMGQPPGKRHSIDRINNDGSYTCGHCAECLDRGASANCRWATPFEQAKNRSNNQYLTIDGETLILGEWARRCGLPASTLDSRIRAGWPADKAIATPAASRSYKTQGTADADRRGHYITFNGETKRLSEWSKSLGIPYVRLMHRLRKGWTIEKSLSTETFTRGKSKQPRTPLADDARGREPAGSGSLYK